MEENDKLTLEQKKLLFKDLCARVPYGVQVKWSKGAFKFDKAHQGIGALYEKDENGELTDNFDIIMSGCFYGEIIKPYLRPMSSMTEKEKEELRTLNLLSSSTFPPKFWLTDWYYEHHFDFRGLIEMGLALEAPEGMYKI